MKHIEITDKDFDGESKIFEADFEKVLLVTENHFGAVNIHGFNDIIRAVDSLLDGVSLLYTREFYAANDADEESLEVVEDAAIVKAIIGANVISMTLGPMGSIGAKGENLADEDRERYEGMMSLAHEAMNLGAIISELSHNISVSKAIDDQEESD